MRIKLTLYIAKPRHQISRRTILSNEIITVPDIGSSDEVEVIEVSVKPGDEIDAETTLLVLESDKASMDVPSPMAGKVVKVLVSEGDKVATGSAIVEIEVAGVVATVPAPEVAPVAAPEPAAIPAAVPVSAAPAASARMEIKVPDLGADDVEIVELSVVVGDVLVVEAPLFTLETDKATMDVPSPYAGTLVELVVKVGDRVSQGDLIGYIETAGEVAAAPSAAPAVAEVDRLVAPPITASTTQTALVEPSAYVPPVAASSTGGKVHAGPAVRLLARELGVDLTQVKGSGPKGRLLKEDLQNYVKQIMQQVKSPAAAGAATGAGIPAVPFQDFSKFGAIEEKPMGRLLKAGAVNLHRSWLNVPHVTQFDEADITELEEFRKSVKAEAEKQGARLTPLPFMIKAAALALKAFPQFNVSLGAQGDTLIWKQYINIGMAVDTPDGLLVVVIKDADKKSIYDLAKEAAELAAKAQNKQLKGADMQGSCFTISSLGSIGGTAFTPIVNAPEVAILGVSKAKMQPVWDGKSFVPRLMLPLSLSYDHRAINGADAARFTVYLAQLLSDVRKMLL